MIVFLSLDKDWHTTSHFNLISIADPVRSRNDDLISRINHSHKESIQDGAVAAIRDGRASFYTVASGLPELKAAVNTYFERYYGYSVAANEVTFATGAKFSLYTFFMAVINPGDEVIIPTPYWVSYGGSG